MELFSNEPFSNRSAYSLEELNAADAIASVERAARLQSRVDVKTAQTIYYQNLPEIIAANRGKFRITLPDAQGAKKSHLFVVRDWDFTNHSEYSLTSYAIEDSNSLVSLHANKGQLAGFIRTANQSYTLLSSAPGVGILLQRNPLTGNQCGLASTKNKAPINPALPTPEPPKFDHIEKSLMCSSNDVRILVLSSARARATGRSVINEALTGVSLLNTMFENSDLDVRATLAGVEELPGFVETNDARRDLRTLGGLFNVGGVAGVPNQTLVQEIENARITHDADLVAIFVDATTWNGVIGIADGFAATPGGNVVLGPPNFLCLVDIGAANEEFTFQHEIGHLFGARHENDEFRNCFYGKDLSDPLESVSDGNNIVLLGHNTDNTPTDSHAEINDWCDWFPLTRMNEAVVSVMFSRADFDESIIRRKARWEVFYGLFFSSEPTTDNRRQVASTAQAVANLQPCRVRFEASIRDAPTYADPGERFRVRANSSGCSGTVRYTWSTSTNGLTYTNAGSGSSVYVRVPSSLSAFDVFFIRLTATCDDGDGNPLNDERIVVTETTVVNPDCGDGIECLEAPKEVIFEAVDVTAYDLLVHPNPANRQITLTVPEDYVVGDKLTITVIDALGKRAVERVVDLRKTFDATTNSDFSLSIDVSGLPYGYYFVTVYTERGKLAKAFVKR